MAELSLEVHEIVSQSGLANEKLQEECSREIGFKIAAKLKDWKMMGSCLSIPSDNLKAIERESDAEYQRGVTVLDIWRKREGRGASYWRLASALYHSGHRDLIKLLCTALLSSSRLESSSHSHTSVQVLSIASSDTDGVNIPDSQIILGMFC